MIVITVLAGITTLAVIKYKDYSMRSGMVNVISDAQSIKDKLMLYYASNESFPLTNFINAKNTKYITNINYVKALNYGGCDGLPADIVSKIGNTENVLGCIELDLPEKYQKIPGSDPLNAAKLYLVASLIGDVVEWNNYCVGINLAYQPQGCVASCGSCQCADLQYRSGGNCLPVQPLPVPPLPVPPHETIDSKKDSLNCDPGSGPSDTGCKKCAVGTISAGGTQGCTDCPAGQFAATDGLTTCTACTSMPGVAGCLPNGGATACIDNYYLNGAAGVIGTTCISCALANSTGCNYATGGATGCNNNYALTGPIGAVGTRCINCLNNFNNSSAYTLTCNSITGGATSCMDLSTMNQNIYLSGPAGAAGTTCIRGCPPHATTCNTNTWGAYGCQQGYSLVGTPGASGSVCVLTNTQYPCPAHATSCNSNNGGAINCDTGYQLSGTSGANGTTCTFKCRPDQSYVVDSNQCVRSTFWYCFCCDPNNYLPYRRLLYIKVRHRFLNDTAYDNQPCIRFCGSCGYNQTDGRCPSIPYTKVRSDTDPSVIERDDARSFY